MARHGSPSTSDNRYASGAAVRACIGECVATGLFSLISLMCYQQLAAPHCAGQPHTLPPDSAVLNGYPCDGSAITRMLYILRHSPMVLWDICWVKFEDVWAATGLLMIYVRFFAAILVPDPFYGQVLAPFTVYYARFVNTAFHVFQGPRYKPSYLGLQSLFSKHAPFEVAFFLSLLGVWRVNMVIELAYCAWAAAATAILWYWYRDFIPGVSFQGQMLTRLIVTLTNIYLDRLLSCRRHQHRGPAGLGRGSGPAARATAATTAAATAAATTAACGSAGSVMCKDAAAAAAIAIKEGAECVGGKEKDAVLKTKFPSSDDSSSAEAVSRPDGILPPAGHVFLRHSKPSAAAPVINSSNSSRGGGDTGSDGNGNSNAGGNGNGSCITSTALSEKEETTSTCWRTAPARVTQASGDVTAAVATPSAPSAGSQDGRMATMVPPTAYRSPCRRRTVLVKIPWAEPEQMTPRFEQRLKALVSEQGLKLTGVYVRRGCVELLMVVEEEVDPPPPPPLALALPAGAGSQSGNTGAWHLDPAALLEALGLAPRESETEWQGPTNGDGAGDGGDGSSSVSSSGCCSGAWAAQQQLLQLITQEDSALLTREAAMQRAAEEVDAATDYIIVTGLEPRVVLMTSSPTPVAAAASSGVPALRLSVAVSRRPPEKQRKQQKQKQQAEEEEAGKVVNQEMGEAEVLVRTANTHLPVRVTTQKMQCRRVGSGSAPVSSKWPFGHEYEYEYEFDIELLDAPPRPGVVLLEFRYRQRTPAPKATASTATAAGVDHLPTSDTSTAPWLRVTLPVLATCDKAVSEELTALVSGWPAGNVHELDELLYDIGVCMAGAAPNANGDGDVTAALSSHILSYAESAGLRSTAANIQEMLRRCVTPGIVVGCGGSVPLDLRDAAPTSLADAGSVESSETGVFKGPARELFDGSCRGEERGDGDGNGGCKGNVAAAASLVHGDGDGGISASHITTGRGSGGVSSWRLALGATLGLRPCSPREAAAFQAFADAWTDGLGHTSHVVECLVLLCLLARGLRDGQQPLGPEHIVVLVGCGLGTVTTLAWLALPHRTWLRLARASKVPRLLGFCASKALILAGLRPPSGASAYAGGPGMLLLEGFILPLACLVSPRTAFFISCLKLLLNYQSSIMVGAASNTLSAFKIAAAVELMSLTITLTCHVYLRCRFDGQVGRAAGSSGGFGGAYGGPTWGTGWQQDRQAQLRRRDRADADKASARKA